MGWEGEIEGLSCILRMQRASLGQLALGARRFLFRDTLGFRSIIRPWIRLFTILCALARRRHLLLEGYSACLTDDYCLESMGATASIQSLAFISTISYVECRITRRVFNSLLCLHCDFFSCIRFLHLHLGQEVRVWRSYLFTFLPSMYS